MSYHRIVVGIDFGTTYSALAWANTSSPGHITLISSWPSAGSRTHHSTPSEISYNEGSNTDYSWGYDISPNTRREKWFKLRLASDDEKMACVGLPSGLTPSDLTRDFLAALYEHTMTTLYRQNSRTVMDMTKVDFVLTVPAVWSEGAKNKTKDAAEAAGISATNGHNLTLLSEPEAAAIYSIKTQDNNSIRVNDRIVVCDAGGGTCDLISYNVLNIHPNLRVVESAVGEGDFCGSTYIDRGFDTWIKQRMGKHYDNLRFEIQQRITKNFEDVKCAFEDRPDKPKFYVSVPTMNTVEEAGVYDGELEITRETMRLLFDPIVDQIIALVAKQVQDSSKAGHNVNAVLLVGGFGESKYVYKRLNEWAEPFRIEVLQPRDAATSVVKGAVMRGLESSLGPQMNSSIMRLARRHYGTPMAQPFIPHKHDEKDAYVDPVTGKKMARNQVSWFIRKGEPIDDARRISRQFTRSFRKYSGPWVDSMVVCELDNPPNRLDENVKPLCNVYADLSNIRKASYERKFKNWRWYYTARYSLDLSIQSGGMRFELVFNGVTYGDVKVSFDQLQPEENGVDY